jgi:hypothetical protein
VLIARCLPNLQRMDRDTTGVLKGQGHTMLLAHPVYAPGLSKEKVSRQLTKCGTAQACSGWDSKRSSC